MTDFTTFLDQIPGVSAAPKDTERGVVEILGFAIIFAAIIIGVILVYTNGLGALFQVQYGMQANAGEQVMVAMAENIDSVVEQKAPKKQIELNLQAVSFGTLATSNYEVEVTDASDTTVGYTEFESQELQYRPENKLEYEVPETTFNYMAGAVIRQDDEHQYMVSEPPFTFTDTDAHLSLVELNGATASGGGSHASVLMSQTDHQMVNTPTSGDATVRIKIQTSRLKAQAWNQYFQQYVNDPGVDMVEKPQNSPISGVVAYEYTGESVVVQKTGIDVEVND
jgi:hypothetical protein